MDKELREEMLALAFAQRDKVFGNSQQREFDCLISLIDYGYIKSFKELAEYGVIKND